MQWCTLTLQNNLYIILWVLGWAGMVSIPLFLGFIVGKPASLKLMGIILLKMKSEFCSFVL